METENFRYSNNPSPTPSAHSEAWNQAFVFLLNKLSSKPQRPEMSKHAMVHGLTDSGVAWDEKPLASLAEGPAPAFMLWTLVVDDTGMAVAAETAKSQIERLLHGYDNQDRIEPVVIVYAPGLNDADLVGLAEAGASVITAPLSSQDLWPEHQDPWPEGEEHTGTEGDGLSEARVFLRCLWEREFIGMPFPHVRDNSIFAWAETQEDPGQTDSVLLRYTEGRWRKEDVIRDYHGIADRLNPPWENSETNIGWPIDI